MIRYISGLSLRAHSHSNPETARPIKRTDSPVYAIDESDLLPVLPTPTDEQRAMHAERMAVQWEAERERLWPALGGHPVAEPLAPIDGIRFQQWPIVPRGGQHVGVSAGVLAVDMATGIGVVEEGERSQYRNRQKAEQRLRRLIVAAHIAAADPMSCPCGRPHLEWCDGGK